MAFAKRTLIALLFAGCGGPQPANYFVGRVYDGVTGKRMESYKLDLQWFDRRYSATLGDRGRFFVGPLFGHHDYTVIIEAEGYRPFMSHNQMLEDAIGGDVSRYFDAYLFATEAKSPPATFSITLDDSDMKPSGTIRLRPTIVSSLYDVPAEQPAGVPTQLWANDEDLQFATVTRPFMNGVASYMEGELVYGVTYQVSIYNVRDHQNFEALYRCGFDGDAAFVVPRLAQAELKLAFASTDLGVPSPTGELVLLFNQDITFDPLVSDAGYVAVLDAGFSIDSPDENMNNQYNTLKSPGNRGVSAEIAGNRLTLRWNRNTGLQTSDAGDPIRSVTWGALSSVRLRPARGPLGSSRSLAELVGAPALKVTVTP